MAGARLSTSWESIVNKNERPFTRSRLLLSSPVPGESLVVSKPGPFSLRSFLRLIAIIVAGLMAFMFSQRSPLATGWTTIEDAKFVAGRHSDGDSIETFVNGERQIFRLYFVDTVERSATAFERRDEQAGYFGDPALSELEALALARDASAFTRDALADGFKVITRWERVNADSDNPSIRAFIQTHEGRDLASLLVGKGLALIKGSRAQANHPDGRSAEQIEKELVSLEEKARAARLGGWALRTQSKRLLPPGVLAASDTKGIEARIGERITVRGRVSRVGQAAGGRIIFVNFDGTGRDGFVAVVRQENGRFAPGLPAGFPDSLDERELEVKGVVTMYEGSPQIEIEKADQIRILAGQ